MNIKALFYFEVSKIIIGILNIIFLVEQYPQISLIISLISIITSMAVFGAVVGDVAVAVFGAGAVLGAMAVAVVGAVVVLGAGAVAVFGDVAVAVLGAVVGAVAVAVVGAGAVLGAMVVDFQEKKNQEVKPKKIKRCSKCKQEVTV